MLRVRTEYRKGVLFVRLIGRVDNEGELEKINNLIKEFGIRFIVLNVTNLSDISLKSISHIINNQEKQEKREHLFVICDENCLRSSLLTSGIDRITNEIEAFSFLNRKDAYE